MFERLTRNVFLAALQGFEIRRSMTLMVFIFNNIYGMAIAANCNGTQVIAVPSAVITASGLLWSEMLRR
jgi:hypothetical protein